MSKQATAVVIVAAVTGALGGVLGRVTAPEHSAHGRATESGAGSSSAPAIAPLPPPPRPAETAGKRRPALAEAVQAADKDAPQAETSLPACVQQLRVVRQLVSDDQKMRAEEEGSPIPARATPPSPRFASESMSGALQTAFKTMSVPGTVDGVDCLEYPCIVFGRIRGTEAEMAKLEHAKSMAAYEEDILTVLLWSATDEDAKDAAEAKHESDEGLEQSLYAVALYPRADKDQLGDNLDRRIRSRTADLWNGMSPSDETSARPEK